MTLTAQSLAQYFRCGHFFKLTQIEQVPNPPPTWQLVSRIVRDAIQADLAEKLASGALLATTDARQGLEAIARRHFQGDIAWTESEASQGQRRTFEAVMLAAPRMYLMWRAVVAPKIDVTGLGIPFELSVGPHVITGIIEIQEPSGLRMTKVRRRSPAAGEASTDLTIAIQALATGADHATVDHLVNTDKMVYVRQEVEIDGALISATEERIKSTLAALEEGVYLPADSGAWWCRACPLRPVCRYV